MGSRRPPHSSAGSAPGRSTLLPRSEHPVDEGRRPRRRLVPPAWWPPPGWRRALVLRRLAAAALAVLAGLLAVAPRAAPPEALVVVAVRDLAAGATVTPADLTLRPLAYEAVPAGALTTVDRATGRLPVGGVRAGEVLTDVRLLGPEAVVAAAGRPDAAGVPLRLADPGVAVLLRPGIRVDVVAVIEEDGPGTSSEPGAAPPRSPGTRESGGVVAAGAVVLAVLPPPERSTSGPVALVSLPAADAARVATTALSREVTVTLR